MQPSTCDSWHTRPVTSLDTRLRPLVPGRNDGNDCCTGVTSPHRGLVAITHVRKGFHLVLGRSNPSYPWEEIIWPNRFYDLVIVSQKARKECDRHQSISNRSLTSSDGSSSPPKSLDTRGCSFLPTVDPLVIVLPNGLLPIRRVFHRVSISSQSVS